MKINELTKEDVFKTLVASAQGLSTEEVQRRLAEFGRNEITAIKGKSLVLRLLGQFTHFLAIVLWLAAFFSFLSEYLNPGEGMLTLGLAIVAVIVINAVFTFTQEYRAEKALEALKKLLPFKVKAIRSGTESEVPAEEVVPGDLIRLAEGDKVPADLRLIESNALKVNNASLTGESEPALRRSEPVPGDPINSPNIAFAGTNVVSGNGVGVVFATGMRTEFGRIALLTETVTPGLSPLQKEIVKATRIVAVIAAVVGAFFFILGFAIGRTFWANFIFTIGITVALIPEGMLPTVTLALAMGSQRMAKRKALIKTLSSVETLGSVTVICTDKTGTLTQNNMAVDTIWVDGEIVQRSPDRIIRGQAAFGVRDQAPLLNTPNDSTEFVEVSTLRTLLTTAALCNNASFADNQYRGDPTETALLKAAREALGDVSAKRLFEIPFDSERKMMTIGCVQEGGTTAFSKGAMEQLLPLCSHFMIKGERKPLEEVNREDVIHADHVLMDMGLRVLAFASKDVHDPASSPPGEAGGVVAHPEDIEKDMTFLGLIGLQDPPRPEVPEAVKKCHGAGIRIIMITGDGSRTALAIAKQIGLVQGTPVIIEGSAFGQMTDQELTEKLASKELIFSRMTPKHKMRVVSLLKDKGEVVAVTGDGVNDAPALKKADIGIAMGITGTDVAKEASNMVLLDDNFATIVNAVEEGRTVYENIKKFLTYIFASNIPEAVPYLGYILFNIPLPLTILQILLVDLGTDMLPALALGAEKPTPGVMQRPPRKVNERLLNFPLVARAYLFLGPLEAVACMFGFFWVLNNGGWTWGTVLPASDLLYMQATTACLTAIVVAQVANVFACRSPRESVFTTGFFANKLIFAAVAVELALQLFIVYHPLGNKVFSTAPISLRTWLVLIPFAFLLLLAEEMRKLIAKKMRPA
ncbi:MAG: cation-transporting P-type ATPase [Nitrospirae bacterium]|nr:cation-transporting P-type ATPase [Nitrospirota bacterium]